MSDFEMKQLSIKRKFENNGYDEISGLSCPFAKKKVKGEEKLNYNVSKEVIFVCSPSADVDPGFVATILCSCDKKVMINHHWATLHSSSPLKVWYGALATFTCESFATAAVHRIQTEYKFLKVLLFKEIVDILLRAELLYPKPAGETTGIVFRAPNPLQDEHVPSIKAYLQSFGKPSKAQLYKNKNPDSIILQVDYPSQFQAYAAKIAMHGTGFKKTGFVSVEIIVTENGKDFDKFVKKELKNCIAEKH